MKKKLAKLINASLRKLILKKFIIKNTITRKKKVSHLKTLAGKQAIKKSQSFKRNLKCKTTI
jgi:hypothetical protein